MARRNRRSFDPADVPLPPAEETPTADVARLSETDLSNLADEFASEIAAQEDARTRQVEDWKRWHEIYLGRPESDRKDFPWEGASNVVVQLAGTMVDATVARIMGQIFAASPHWVGSQVNPNFAPAVKPLERYMDWARENVWNQKRAVKPAVLEMTKIGTMVMFQGWQDRQFFRFDEATRQPVPAGRAFGPAPKWVPREDFLIPAGFDSIDSAPWVAHRQWFSLPELQSLEHQGFFRDIQMLRGKSDDETELRRSRRNDQGLPSPDLSPADRDQFGIWSPWAVWFSRDLDDDGFPEGYVLTLHAGSKHVLRIRANSYLTGMRPFISARFVEIEGEFDGLGICQQLEHYQAEASTTHNQRRDNMHLKNTAMFAARRGSGITGRERWFPGRIWVMQDPKSDLVPINLGGTGSDTVVEEQLLLGLAKERVGLTDINLGKESSPLGRAAATTVLSLLQEGSTRRDFTTQELRDALDEQGLQLIELYQTHGLPEAQAPGSPEIVLASETGEEAQALRQLFEIRDDVRGLVGLKLNVATAAVNREIEKQSNMQLFGLLNQYIQQAIGLTPLLANPQVPPAAKEAIVRGVQGLDRLMQRTFQAFQVFDLDSVLLADLLGQVAQSPPPMPEPQPGAAQGANGVVSAENLPPELLQQLRGGG